MSKLKHIREAHKMSQSQLAESSGVNVRMIQHYEQGFKDINKASAITAYKLARALNTRIENLLEIR